MRGFNGSKILSCSGELKKICPNCRGTGYWLTSANYGNGIERCQYCEGVGKVSNSKEILICMGKLD